MHTALLKCIVVGLGLLWFSPAPAAAQALGQSVSQIVTIDRQRLFNETSFGRRVVSTVETERERLAAETRRVEAALVEEEQELTTRRAELEPGEFRKLAQAFDEKVNSLRAEGEAREQSFVSTLEREQSAFFEKIGPILGRLVRELGAVVILDRRAILLTTQNLDITDLAIERIDAELGDGAQADPSAQDRDANTQTDPEDANNSEIPAPNELAPQD